MQTAELQVVIWKEGKHYVAQCLNVDVSSFGKSVKEAQANIKEALELYLEDEKMPPLIKVEKPIIVKQQLRYA